MDYMAKHYKNKYEKLIEELKYLKNLSNLMEEEEKDRFTDKDVDDLLINYRNYYHSGPLNWTKGKKIDLTKYPKPDKKFGEHYTIDDTYIEPIDIKNLKDKDIDWDRAIG